MEYVYASGSVIAAHSAYDMFSKYKCLIVNLVFSHLGFWSGNFFLIAPFPDHCLLVFFFIDYYTSSFSSFNEKHGMFALLIKKEQRYI